MKKSFLKNPCFLFLVASHREQHTQYITSQAAGGVSLHNLARDYADTLFEAEQYQNSQASIVSALLRTAPPKGGWSSVSKVSDLFSDIEVSLSMETNYTVCMATACV
jgi:hypothetical protein